MIALTSLVFLFVVTLGGILANRVWTLSKLGFEH
jgi:hypothetical protein